MITILQMAAGAGKRFDDSSTSSVPKVLHRVDRIRVMWEYVAWKQGIGTLSSSMHIQTGLVVPESHNDLYLNVTSESGSTPYHNKLIRIPEMHTQGPAWSVAAATLDMPENNELILIDSDCFIESSCELSPLEQVLNTRQHLGTTACMFAVRAKEVTHHASQINHQDFDVTSVKEGNVGKDELINVGVYYFKSIGHFRRMLRSIYKVRGEVKINDLINIEAKANTGWEQVSVDMMVGEFVNLGTPELLEKYRREKGYAK